MGFNSAFKGLNEHFGIRSQALLLKELCPQSDKSLVFHYKRKPSCKTPTHLRVDGCSVQAQALNAFTAHTLPAVFPS